MGLQSYCRNDGAPGLVAASVFISTACNIFGDWLLIFPIPWCMKGAAIATGASQLVACLIMLTHFNQKKDILRFGSTLVVLVYIVFGKTICMLFGADAATLDYTVKILPMYCIGFFVMALNTMLSAYLYSTERSNHAIVISVLRSIVVNATVILLLPKLFGAETVWLTFAVYEAIVLVVAVALLKHSERNGIVFK